MNNQWKKKFFTIYLGQAFSILGSAAVQFAIIWYLTLQTESAITLTTAAIVGFLPGAILGPFAGVWIDRYNRKTIMILADGFIALSSVFLGIAFVTLTHPPLAFIYLVLFLRGIGTIFHAPAMYSAIPTFVPAEELTKVGGWGSFITSGSNLLGPLLGATLMGILPISTIMLVDIFGAIFAIICLLFVKIPNIEQHKEKTHFWNELKQGFVAIKKNKLLVAALPQYVLVGILYFPLSSLFPLLVLTYYNGGAFHNALIDVTFATGMIIASLIVGIWGGMKRKLAMFSFAIMLLGFCSLAIGILPPSLFAICLLLTFILGTSATFFNVPFNAYVQESIAPHELGRVISLLFTICTLANPIGLALSGPISEIIGINKWFAFSGIVLIINGFVCLLRTKKPELQYIKEVNAQQVTEKQ